MSLITELTQQLRSEAEWQQSGGDDGLAKMLSGAADVIEDLSAKLAAANMERSKKNTESKCHNCFGAANNDCRFCEDDGK